MTAQEILFEPKKDLNRWLDINDDDYHATTGISSTNIRQMMKSPYNFYSLKVLGYADQKEETPAMKFGKLVHSAILEPDKFVERYRVAPNDDARTKEYRMFESDLPPDVTSMKPRDFDRVRRIMDRVNSVAHARNIFASKGQAEKSGFWIDPATKILCKCRLDYFTDDGHIVDLKTTQDASQRAFTNSIAREGYHYQMAWYLRGYEAITGKKASSIQFICPETSPPYDCAIYYLSGMQLDVCQREIDSVLIQMKDCFDNNEWNGYSNQAEAIELPDWAF